MLQMSELAVQKACQSYTYVMVPNVKFQMVTVIRTLGWEGARALAIVVDNLAGFNERVLIYFIENYVCSLL